MSDPLGDGRDPLVKTIERNHHREIMQECDRLRASNAELKAMYEHLLAHFIGRIHDLSAEMERLTWK